MANVLSELFQDIADAIRSKTGSTATLKPNQFPEAIEGITTGGGGSSSDVRYVTFRNESTGEEYKKPVAYGDDCVDVVAKGLWKTPTKESTAQYDYTFYGWGALDNGAADANILKNITEDKTVYAIFASTVRTYTITWLDDDGVTVLKTESLAYGTVPSYAPIKDDAVLDYWTPTPTAVTGEASYTAAWSSVLASGKCGSNATWSLSADGVLTISGTGAMYTYTTRDSVPWHDYRNDITSAVIGHGITITSAYFVCYCPNLLDITIPDSVTEIGNVFAQGCTSLQSITIPDSVVSLGNSHSSSFNFCTSLKTAVFGKNIAFLHGGMLRGCSSLESLTIPFAGGRPRTASSDVSYSFGFLFGKNSYDGGVATTQVEKTTSGGTSKNVTYYIPSSLKSVTVLGGGLMPMSAFINCVNLTDVTLCDGITQSGGNMFKGCSNLTNVTLPNTLENISGSDFTNCSRLEEITVPSGVTRIIKGSFTGCTSLTSAEFVTPNGWFVTDEYGGTSGTNVDLADPQVAAEYLTTTHVDKYWYRTNA